MRVGKEEETILDQSKEAKKSLKSGKRKVDRLNTQHESEGEQDG
jgi:hypothetical protein